MRECVVVSQLSLDVELWMNEVLQGELEGRGFTFHSLTDYDLQLVEVCDGDVVFLIVVMLEASGCSPSVYAHTHTCTPSHPHYLPLPLTAQTPIQ